VDLLAVGDQGVPGQRVVVLPARQLSDAPHGTDHRPKSRTVTLSPDDALVVGRRDLAPALTHRAVGIEEQLGVE